MTPSQYAGFGKTGLEGVVLLYAFSLVTKLCNKGGTLYGGAASTLVDVLSTSAITLATTEYWYILGVSRTLAAHP